MHTEVSGTLVQKLALQERYFHIEARSLPAFKAGRMIFVNYELFNIFSAY